jgi:hypothetical protein
MISLTLSWAMISVSQSNAKNQVRDQPFDGEVGLKEDFSAGGGQRIEKTATPATYSTAPARRKSFKM